jgi:hypothetical protein
VSLIFCDSFDVIPEPTGWSFTDEDLKCIALGMNQAGALAAELLMMRRKERYEKARTNDQWVLQRVRTASTMHVRRPLPNLYERCPGRDRRSDSLPELCSRAAIRTRYENTKDEDGHGAG